MNDQNSPGFISRLSGFASHPFNTDMDLASWALFVAFLVTVVILWSKVLGHVLSEV